MWVRDEGQGVRDEGGKVSDDESLWSSVEG